jgi:hypothetical protein
LRNTNLRLEARSSISTLAFYTRAKLGPFTRQIEVYGVSTRKDKPLQDKGLSLQIKSSFRRDALILGSSGRPWGFKSLYAHHNLKKTPEIGDFGSLFVIRCFFSNKGNTIGKQNHNIDIKLLLCYIVKYQLRRGEDREQRKIDQFD